MARMIGKKLDFDIQEPEKVNKERKKIYMHKMHIK